MPPGPGRPARSRMPPHPTPCRPTHRTSPSDLFRAGGRRPRSSTPRCRSGARARSFRLQRRQFFRPALPEDECDRVGTAPITSTCAPTTSSPRPSPAPWSPASARASILILSSTNGFQSEPDSTAYDTSKGALVMLTRSLAHSLAPHGIRVNGIAPGSHSHAADDRLAHGQTARNAPAVRKEDPARSHR
jgi:NAD(P)-dependent dehydrogenase (short-subunit alcohol dehydrogenase family)